MLQEATNYRLVWLYNISPVSPKPFKERICVTQNARTIDINDWELKWTMNLVLTGHTRYLLASTIYKFVLQ